MKNIEKLLIRLGLNTSEATIYLALLSNDSLTVSGISQITGLHRPIIYKGVKNLIVAGLITQTIRGKQKKYVAEPPQTLHNLAHTLINDVDGALPELEELYEAKETKPTIKYLEGKTGISKAFDDVVDSLKAGEEFYRYSAAFNQTKVNTYVPKEYRTKRDQKKLERYVITNQRAGEQKKPRMERDMKFIDTTEELFKQNVIQFIYGDKISLLDFNSDTAVIIENKAVADFQKKIFKSLFKRL